MYTCTCNVMYTCTCGIAYDQMGGMNAMIILWSMKSLIVNVYSLCTVYCLYTTLLLCLF